MRARNAGGETLNLTMDEFSARDVLFGQVDHNLLKLNACEAGETSTQDTPLGDEETVVLTSIRPEMVAN